MREPVRCSPGQVVAKDTRSILASFFWTRGISTCTYDNRARILVASLSLRTSRNTSSWPLPPLVAQRGDAPPSAFANIADCRLVLGGFFSLLFLLFLLFPPFHPFPRIPLSSLSVPNQGGMFTFPSKSSSSMLSNRASLHLTTKSIRTW